MPPATSSIAPVRARRCRSTGEHSDDGGVVVVTALRRQTPAWVVSLLVHVVVLLMLALIVSRPDEKPRPQAIEAAGAESDSPLEEFVDHSMERPEADAVALPDAAANAVVIPAAVVAAPQSVAEPMPTESPEFDFGGAIAMVAEINHAVGNGMDPVGGFGWRKHRGKGTLGTKDGPSPDTEAAVDLALKWLAEHQLADGSWSFNLKRCEKCGGACGNSGNYPDDAGATSMALLPFLGRGYTHKEGPYKAQIAAGLKALAARSLANQGAVYGGGGHQLYVQGLGGIVLAEAYGMTQDDQLRAAAQYALNHIMEAQDPVGGGWRYQPRQPGDTSAVGWQIMALKSGHMAYLEVNPVTIRKAAEFLDAVSADSGAAYGYTGPGKGAATTAVGLLCRMYLGWKKDHPALQRGVATMARQGPSSDLYFSYYATQVMHHIEGDAWRAWNDRMKALLLPAQAKNGHATGSWFEGVNGGHSSHGGRLYCTSLATLMLEVYYRHAPLYRTNAVDDQFRE